MISKKVLLSFLCLGLLNNQVKAIVATDAELKISAQDLVDRFKAQQAGTISEVDRVLFLPRYDLDRLKLELAADSLDDLQDLYLQVHLFMQVIESGAPMVLQVLLQGIEPRSAKKQKDILETLPSRLLTLKRQIENAILAKEEPIPVDPTPIRPIPVGSMPTTQQVQKIVSLTKELLQQTA